MILMSIVYFEFIHRGFKRLNLKMFLKWFPPDILRAIIGSFNY